MGEPAVPGVEEIARVIVAAVKDSGLFVVVGEPDSSGARLIDGDVAMPAVARAILDLFAPILAEKEREIAAAIESHDAWAEMWNEKLEALEARALAAEAALAGERERIAAYLDGKALFYRTRADEAMQPGLEAERAYGAEVCENMADEIRRL